MKTDDVVLQTPEDLHLLVPVFHTSNSCPGAVTAHLLRRIAYRAGAYAPGIQEHIFHELNTSREGGTIEKVQRWFTSRAGSMADLGYRIQARRVALPTPALIEWVRQGKGYRGAMLPTNFKRLHPAPNASGGAPDNEIPSHAVGLTIDKLTSKGTDEMVMIDPWPGVDGAAKDRDKPPAVLEQAHKDRGNHALVYFWSGWS